MTNLIGQSLGRYHILEQLGEGGMATVYKAYDTRLERNVAIKVIRTDVYGSSVLERILKRFEREAKALARLSHPNIVKVHDYGEYEGAPYLVMEYLPGGTLKQKLGKPIRWQDAARLIILLARAMEFAHQRGVVHRDVKPSNILITESGEPMLSDFGVAKIFDEEATVDLTGTSATVGTPEYMAPEQVVSKSVDHRADIYALGVVFYEMVTGRKPYLADTPMAVLFKHASEPLPLPKSFVPDLPDDVEKVLIKALAKQPEDRYQNMTELAIALEELLIGADEIHPEVTTTPAVGRKAKLPFRAKTTMGREDTHDKVVVPRKKVGWWLWAASIGGLVLITLVIIGLSKNTGAVIPLPLFETSSPTTTLMPKLTLAPTASLTPTVTLIPTASLTPTITPTPTPMIISVDNAAKVAFLRQLDGPSGGMAFSPDGEILASGMRDASVELWRVSDGTMLLKLEGHSMSVNSVAFSPDGQLLVSGSDDQTIRIWQVADGTLLYKPEPGRYIGYVESVAFSPDGKTLASGTSEGAQLWKTVDGNLLWTLSHSRSVPSVAFSPDGETLASGQDSGTVVLWRFLSGTLLRGLYGHESRINSLAFSPDGQIIASGSGDGTVRLWRVSDGTVLHTLEVHEYGVGSVAFSPDGQILATGSADYVVRLWRVADWTLLSKLEGHTGGISHVAFSPDGKILASASYDGSVRFWEVMP